jgi:hypothetical protein
MQLLVEELYHDDYGERQRDTPWRGGQNLAKNSMHSCDCSIHWVQCI